MAFVGKLEYARSFRDREELFPLEGKKSFGWVASIRVPP